MKNQNYQKNPFDEDLKKLKDNLYDKTYNTFIKDCYEAKHKYYGLPKKNFFMIILIMLVITVAILVLNFNHIIM